MFVHINIHDMEGLYYRYVKFSYGAELVLYGCCRSIFPLGSRNSSSNTAGDSTICIIGMKNLTLMLLFVLLI